MTTYTPYTQGKQYDPAHLRPFDLELAKAGHPLAWSINSCEVRYLAQSYADDDRWFDFSHYEPHEAVWINRTRSALEVQQSLCRAPLAIKHNPRTGKDEPLHVGDVIEVQKSKDNWVSARCEFIFKDHYINFQKTWRWTVEARG